MAYCTLTQLQDRYGLPFLIELSFRGDTAPTEPDAALFTRALADADALIDGYLLGRYALPLSSLPSLLVDLSQRIAIYNAHANVAGDKIRNDYDDALKTLSAIARGDVRLNIAGVEPTSSETGGVLATENDKPLTVDAMKGYI